MIMKYIMIFAFIVAIQYSTAQTKHLDPVFSEVSKTTFKFDTYNNESLQFDYYVAKKSREETPLLVYAHGGGFSGGARDDKIFVSFATKLAQRGYAVASVSYRLTMKDTGFGCDVETSKKIAAIDSATQDISLAIKYILKNSEKFRINRNKIILAGSSAGAETVLNLVYVSDKHPLPFNFTFAGVISMAGAITTLDKINHKTAIPTMFFHGTSDETVPYNVGAHRYCSSTDTGYLLLYGSAAIAKKLKTLDAPYYLYSIKGGSHSWASLPITNCLNEILDFLYYDVMHIESQRQTEKLIDPKERKN